MLTDPVAILALLFASVAVAEWLARRGLGRHLGSAILVIVVGAVLGNSGIVPSASSAPPIYDAVFRVVGPLCIFLLLLDVRLGELRRVGWPMLVAFVLATLGTLLGVVVGYYVTDLPQVLGERAGVVAGMYTGTYIGGSANFNAIALHYGVVEDGILFAGATAVDAILGTVWIVVILGMPSLLRRTGIARQAVAPTERATSRLPVPEKKEVPVSVGGLAVLFLLALAALYLSQRLSDVLANLGIGVPSILLLTTFALVLAQLPWVHDLGNARVYGIFAANVFLAVIGIHCELSTVQELGTLGPALLAFVTVALVVHTLLLAGTGILLRLDPDVLAMASNATIMGATTAPAVAESRGRHDLVLPGILTGALGGAVGTYLGFLVAALL